MKSIVVIGGATGIGLALVQRLAVDPNNKITVIARENCAVAGINNISADVTDKDIGRKISALEAIDVLVYCAGVSIAAPVEYADADDVKRIFDVNIVCAVACIKAALPALGKSDRAKIVLLSSSGGVAPIAFDAFYSATKAGLNTLAAAIRLECPRVKCTAAVIPGTQTQFSFKRKVYTDCGQYDERLKSASDALIKIEQTGYSADYVSARIVSIIESRNPPPTVTIGCKNKLMLGMYNILPWRIKLFALRKIYKI